MHARMRSVNILHAHLPAPLRHGGFSRTLNAHIVLSAAQYHKGIGDVTQARKQHQARMTTRGICKSGRMRKNISPRMAHQQIVIKKKEDVRAVSRHRKQQRATIACDA